jgi:hypothetical protein
VNYPTAQKPASGKLCGGTIQVDVPFSGFGRPVNANTLFSVTALAYGQIADEDLYSDIDTSRAFNYTRGSNISPTGC